MKTVLMVLLAGFAMKVLADDSVASAVPFTSTLTESKYSATTGISDVFNKSLVPKFKDKSVFVIKENDAEFDEFVDSVFVTHGVKLAKQEVDADIVILIDDVSMSYARDGDHNNLARYISIATAPDQGATYELLVANAETTQGGGGSGAIWFGPDFLVHQALLQVTSPKPFVTRRKGKTGPFNQTITLNVTLQIKGEDGKYIPERSGFFAKTKDEILRIKKEELFASALDCLITCK